VNWIFATLSTITNLMSIYITDDVTKLKIQSTNFKIDGWDFKNSSVVILITMLPCFEPITKL